MNGSTHHDLTRRGRNRFFFNNDGGTLCAAGDEAPISLERFVELAIGPLCHTQVDTFLWTLGTDPYHGVAHGRLSDWYCHDTKIGSCWGVDGRKFLTSGEWRIYENTRALMEQGYDPPAVVCEYGHAADLDVFISMRVNDVHDGRLGFLDHPNISPMKREHPDWLLGRTSRSAEGPTAGMSQFGYNFALSEVRDYKFALAEEAVNRYDIDGLDWDFCRHPRFFPEGEGPKHAEKMTELIRRLRALLDAKSKRTGRKVKLSVRVPPQFQLCLNTGLDVKTWLEEGLIDFLIAGYQWNVMHRMPSEAFITAARETGGSKVIAQCLGQFRKPRPLGSKVLWDEKGWYSDEMRRATAALNWMAGFDGIYVFNHYHIPYVHNAAFTGNTWREIGDPAYIDRLDKHYIVDDQITSAWEVEMGTKTKPDQPLPAVLADTGEEALVPVYIADDLEKAKRDGRLAKATLRMMVLHLTAADRVEMKVNGKAVDFGRGRRTMLYNECWLDFDACEIGLRKGRNDLVFSVKGRNERISTPLSVEDVEVLVRYRPIWYAG